MTTSPTSETTAGRRNNRRRACCIELAILETMSCTRGLRRWAHRAAPGCLTSPFPWVVKYKGRLLIATLIGSYIETAKKINFIACKYVRFSTFGTVTSLHTKTQTDSLSLSWRSRMAKKRMT